MTGRSWTVNSEHTRDSFKSHVDHLFQQYGYVQFQWTTGRQRTLTQNRALHLWCRLVADCLNNAGLEMSITIPGTSKEWEIPWCSETVKESIWKPVQDAMLNKKSTTEAERQEYNEVCETICRRFAKTFGIRLPDWPTKDQADGS